MHLLFNYRSLPTLGGSLKNVFGDVCAVSYFDRQIEAWVALGPRLENFCPDLIGISAQFGSVADLAECLRLLDDLGSTALRLVGNVVGTYAADELVRRHQGLFCCTGRGEESLACLVEWLRSERTESFPAGVPNVVYVDEAGQLQHSETRSVPDWCIAPVDWDGYSTVYDLRQYHEVWVESSRGCPQKRNNVGCTYCAILPEAGSRGWRPRQMDVVLTDVAALARHGVPHVRFADEEFMANEPARAVEFAHSLRALQATLATTFELPTFDVAMRVDDVVRPNPTHDRARWQLVNDRSVFMSTNELRRLALRELQDVGLRQVYLGLESGSAPQLHRMRKGVTPAGNATALRVLRSLDLQAACGWIMFDPFLQSASDLLDNIEFIDRNGLIPKALGDSFVTSPVNTMRVLVGTPLKDKLAEAGLLRPLLENLLEYGFVYQNRLVGEVVDRLQAWTTGYEQPQLYALKNQVAHAALTEASDNARHHVYFQLKRLDLEVCRWLAEELLVAEHARNYKCIAAIPQRFQDQRSALLSELFTVL